MKAEKLCTYSPKKRSLRIKEFGKKKKQINQRPQIQSQFKEQIICGKDYSCKKI